MVTPNGIVDWIITRLDEDDYRINLKKKISNLEGGSQRLDKFLESDWLNTPGKKEETIQETAQQIYETRIEEATLNIDTLTDLNKEIDQTEFSTSIKTTLQQQIKTKLEEIIPEERITPPPQLSPQERRTKSRSMIGDIEGPTISRIRDSTTESEIEDALTEAETELSEGELGEIITPTERDRVLARLDKIAEFAKERIKAEEELIEV